MFSVQALFDSRTGAYSCVLAPSSNTLSEFSVADVVQVDIIAGDFKHTYQFSKSVAIPFVPAFKLPSHRIEVPYRAKKAKFDILMTPTTHLHFSLRDGSKACQMEAKSNKCDLGKVTIVHLFSLDNGTTVFEVTLKDDTDEYSVVVSNPLTQQEDTFSVALGKPEALVDHIPTVEVLVHQMDDVSESSAG